MEGSVIRRCPFHDRGNMKAQRKEESTATAKPPLWTRGFILLALIQTLDLFTYNMITPVIAQYATGLGLRW